MIGAGELDKRVAIEQRVVGSPQKLPSGAPNDTWVNVTTVWARIEPLRGKEFLEAQAIQSSVTTRIRVRNRSGVTAGMRVTRGADVYNIEYVMPPRSADGDLELMCSIGASDG